MPMNKRWWALFGIIWLGFYILFRWHSVVHQGLRQASETSSEWILLSLLFIPIRVLIELWMFGLPALIPAIGGFVFVKALCKAITAHEKQRIRHIRSAAFAFAVLLLGVYLVLHWWSLPTSSGPLPWGGLGGGPSY